MAIRKPQKDATENALLGIARSHPEENLAVSPFLKLAAALTSLSGAAMTATLSVRTVSARCRNGCRVVTVLRNGAGYHYQRLADDSDTADTIVDHGCALRPLLPGSEDKYSGRSCITANTACLL